ncbi:CoA pyrophosphatase [Alisedimentitalea sp. MJ-SS2]|uniref:NUDIX hydrolase n=1 Tax=Aliisedimentitalea sp. MJ-SS2 TaxID=3049795 RepID=UPI002906D6F8|nr:CoA pyrophosphatase [Alisedimentitalea sp. MJ-SS2]MDU8927423.1 CoA pyrophosphatase [Alisedimentitalea sp. MJ-SS2]
MGDLIRKAAMAFDRFDRHLRSDVHARLERFEAVQLEAAGLREAAVAIVLAQDPETGRPSVVLTRRPTTMNRHAGQYALPGGRVDAGETATQAALREVEEEIGLQLGKGDILGRLDDFETRSGFRIEPFVLWCGDVDRLAPDPREVEAVFFIPFTELDDTAIPTLHALQAGESPVMSAFLPTLGHHIYAPTAAMLYQFREVGLRGEATRVAHFEQPSFAWK